MENKNVANNISEKLKCLSKAIGYEFGVRGEEYPPQAVMASLEDLAVSLDMLAKSTNAAVESMRYKCANCDFRKLSDGSAEIN
jgi:hypothetical protein